MSFIKKTVRASEAARSAPLSFRRVRARSTASAIPQGWGNQSIQRLLRSGAVQTKLTVNQPGDAYEQEADRVADQVMRLPDSLAKTSDESAAGADVSIQRKCAECSEEEVQRHAADDEKLVQPGPEGEQPEGEEEEDETGMPKREIGAGAPTTSAAIRVPKQGGQPLETGVQRFMEGALGRSFTDVQVHTDDAAATSARQLHAHAYTVGSDIYFNAGQYRPSSPEGRKLLAHELTHVVQQTGGAPGATTARRQVQRCPQGKQPRVVRNDCATAEPADTSNFIRHLEVSIAAQTVTATWGPRSTTAPATRTNTWDCSPHPSHTPTGPDRVGIKCSENHTNLKKDGMAWFTGFASQGYRIGFHDSQRVGPGIHSHGCVRVRCATAQTINANTWSGVTTINVA